MTTSTSPVSDDRIPVIVGVGEIIDRPQEITAGLEPLTLLVEVLKRADADSGGKLLPAIASLDIVHFLSWRYQDPAKHPSHQPGIQPAHGHYGPLVGAKPLPLHDAASHDSA